MRGIGRFFAVLFLPLFFTLATLILALVTFFGSYKNAWGLRDVYYMKLDFTNLTVSGISTKSLGAIENSLNISTIYQVGTNGYCFGSTVNGSVHLDGCRTPTTPFWFNIEDIFGHQQNTTAIASVKLPREVTGYETTLKNGSYALWSFYIAVIALSFIGFLIGSISLCSTFGSCLTTIVMILCSVCAVLATCLVTGIYRTYSSKFNAVVQTLGVRSSMGSSGLVLSWVTAGLSVFSSVLWLFIGRCCCIRRTVYVEDKKNYIHGYAPQFAP